jgi:DNA topoisomerase II
MDDSVFDVSDGSDFAPEPVSPPLSSHSLSLTPAKKAKAKTVTKKAATSKPAAKKAAAPKAKPGPKPKSTVPKKRSKKDSDDEDDGGESENNFDDESLLVDTPPKAKKQKTTAKAMANPVKDSHKKPLGDLVNEAMAKDPESPQPKKKKRVSEQYQKLTQLEHIIRRPDTYIGSVERSERQMWVFNQEQDCMEFREVSYVPGIFKIFDEVLVNAADNKQNDKNQDYIKVRIDQEKGQISVENNGRGIPIEIHSKERIYIPEMIFGHLLTGSNYDDDEQKVTGGRNGYGAKLCNIFSTRFTVETASAKHKKRYTQTWTSNMSKMGEAEIEDQKGEDYTKVTFQPDFAKFGMTGMDDDLQALFVRRVYDLAGAVKGVKVYLNGKLLPVQKFEKYCELYTQAIKRERGEEAAGDSNNILFETPKDKDAKDRWQVGFAVSDGSFQQVSFVNSVSTTSGGTHVNYIADQIVTKLIDIVKKKNKGGPVLKPNQIRNHIFLFVNAQIVNPAFTSQTKEQLTTKTSQFGSKFQISDDFMKKIAKTEVINNILHFAQQKADQILKKSDGSKRSRMNNPKLVDANKAGTRDGWRCTLILTEGDSAKGLAMAGRSMVSPDHFGVFPLRGKILNVRDASIDQISKNAEIQNIKSFLGLQHKKVYTDTKGLRYGHLMIMTDQDHDGSHIKGLLINFLQVQYPSLLKIDGFLTEFITPIVKTYKGDPKEPTKQKAFFTMPEYLEWKEAHKHEKGWEHKYYKGLGTSTSNDAKEYFGDLDKHHKEFEVMRDEETALIELAFSKKKADERKEWLRQFKPGTFLDHSSQKITYTEFINKELILFSMADNIRSIPSVIDGLKPGQRKVLYTAFKRNLKKDMKVVELAGIVLGMTAYAHGETSLQQTIIGLAQTFVGSNNVNCLEPSGMFGSRLQGGSDAASARYIYTRLSPFARKLFHQADEPLLSYNTDDDRTIEPEIYAPVVPVVLINGTDGIGTGWSSSIPNYNPVDIVDNLKRRMDGEEWKPMEPWFRGFKGQVAQTAPDRYRFSGIVNQSGDNEVEITELPIRYWTQDFKDKLEDIIKADKSPSFIKDYKDYNTHENVHFVIQMDDKHMEAALKEGLEERFKLTKSVATSNLVAFDPEGRITKYNAVEDIMQEFFSYRLKLYAKRKAYMLETLNRELRKFSEQARFVKMIIDGKLVISKKKKAALVAELQALKFEPFPKTTDSSKRVEDVGEDEEDGNDDVSVQASAYDYLLGMPLWSLTQERVDKLERQKGDKEDEINILDKKSIKDLWKADLDDFIDTWHTQLREEAEHSRKASKNRRVSKKFDTGKQPGRKRKAGSDDDDFKVKPKKMPAKKAPVPKQTSLADMLNKPPVKKLKYDAPKSRSTLSMRENWAANMDGSSGSGTTSRADTPAETESKASSSKVAKKVVKDESEDEIVSKPAARTARTAKKPAQYTIASDSESDSDNGDGLLADLGGMVRGLPGKSEAIETKPLFSTSTSRPSSSHDFKMPTKPAPKISDSISDDETDYKALAPQSSPRRSILVTNKDTSVFDVSDDDDIKPASKPAKKAPGRPKKSDSVEPSKPKAQPKKAPAAKKTGAPKKVEQSPVAKAYAKRLAKKKILEDSDDEMDDGADDLVDDILKSPLASDDDDEDESIVKPVKASARPGRRAATTAKKPVKYDFGDGDSDEENEFDLDESSVGFDDESD